VTEAKEKTRSQLKFRRAGKTLIKIIDEERAKDKMNPKELKADSRRSLRAAIAKRALDESGLSLAESAACGGDHFEHRTGGCSLRRSGTGIGVSYCAI
jgi:hypothetical protein